MEAIFTVLIDALALLLMTGITIGLPLLFRYAAKKWKIEIDEGQQRILMEAARRAVRVAEEESRRRLGERLSGEEKHAMATSHTKKLCGDRECSEEDIDDAVSAAVNELREKETQP